LLHVEQNSNTERSEQPMISILVEKEEQKKSAPEWFTCHVSPASRHQHTPSSCLEKS